MSPFHIILPHFEFWAIRVVYLADLIHHNKIGRLHQLQSCATSHGAQENTSGATKLIPLSNSLKYNFILFCYYSIFKAKLTGENTREVTYDILVSAISKKVVCSADDSEPFMQIFVNLCMYNIAVSKERLQWISFQQVPAAKKGSALIHAVTQVLQHSSVFCCRVLWNWLLLQ